MTWIEQKDYFFSIKKVCKVLVFLYFDHIFILT